MEKGDSTNQQQAQSTSCKGGCGFFGTPGNHGYCSVCVKNFVSGTDDQPPDDMIQPSLLGANSSDQSTIIPKTNMNLTSSTAKLISTELIEDEAIDDLPQPAPNKLGDSFETEDNETQISSTTPESQKKKKHRCEICNKRVGLSSFNCRCGLLLCSQHRYAKEHNCTVDYKEIGRKELTKANPVVTAEKIRKL